MKFQKLIFILIIILPLCSYSQTGYSPLSFMQEDLEKNVAKSEAFGFYMHNTNFFRNNEFFNDIIEGYTLPGTELTSSFVYQNKKNTRFEAGMNFRYFYGDSSGVKALPHIRIYQKLGKNIAVIFGNLYRRSNHGLIPVFMDPEKLLRDPEETGLQFLFDFKHFSSDLWVDWERFIWYDDPGQEVFTAGNSSILHFTIDDEFSFEVPLQFLFVHHGGQINLPGKSIETIGNFAGGIAYKYLSEKTKLSRASLSAMALNYSDLSPHSQQEHTNGLGLYAQMQIETQNLGFSASYYQGKNMFLPHGEGIFAHQSGFKDSYLETRKLIMANLYFRKTFSQSVKCMISLNPYFDLESQKLDYSYGFYLQFSKDFFKD